MNTNPKIVGTNLFACRPQTGLCPNNCNQCFFNRENAFYCDINKPFIPDPEEVGNGIVRMNDGHDSNINKDKVLEAASKYKHVFFNTSHPNFDFPGPVVFTANGCEKQLPWDPSSCNKEEIKNLMFVRLRVSSSNFDVIEPVFKSWLEFNIPIVLTFMAYYEEKEVPDPDEYEYKVRHINSYWCPKRPLKARLYQQYQEAALEHHGVLGMNLVKMCGTLDSNFCAQCGNCENLYHTFKGK